MNTTSEKDDAAVEIDEAANQPRGRKKLFILIGAFGPLTLVAVLLIWGTIEGGGRPGGVFVNSIGGVEEISPRPAPDFTLTTFDGESVTLSDFHGRVVFIDFWASWCPPCRAEAPTLRHVAEQFSDKDVTFIGVDVWDRPGQGRSFAREAGLDYPNGIDQNGVITIEYGVKGLPEKFFVDAEGNLVKKFVGPITVPELTNILNEMLGEPVIEPLVRVVE